MCGAEDPIAATFKHLDLVIEPFDEATALAVEEVVRALIQATLQGREEAVKAGEPALFDETGPALEVVAGFSFAQRSIEDEGEDLAQPMGCFQGRGMRKQPIELLLLLGAQVEPRSAEQPQRAFERGILLF